jgi:hypothetical protein
MDSGDVAMIISFSDSPRVKQMFTHNRRHLRRALESIEPSQRRTSLAEALKFSASLANPGRTGEDPGDFQVAEPLPATLLIFSDGKFPSVSSFRLGNLDPIYVPVGSADAGNVGITAFSVRRHELDPMSLQAFARLQNFSSENATVSAELRKDGKLFDADRVEIDADKATSVIFPLGIVESGVLELRVESGDHLKCDDVAWTVVNPPQKSKVLIVTPGNRALDAAFGTESVLEIADVTFDSPDCLQQEEHQRRAATGAYDLVIYDRCRPKQMPEANTLFIAVLPPGQESRTDEGDGDEAEQEQADRDRAWGADAKVDLPVIIDADTAHPLMHWINIDRVIVTEATPLQVPQGGTVLLDSVSGPLLAVAPREGFKDAVMAFALIYQDIGEGGTAQTLIGTNWWFKPSFTVFVLNVLDYLGTNRAALGTAALQPGKSVTLDSPNPGQPLEVSTPSGETVRLKESSPGKFSFTGTSTLGVYEVRSKDKALQRFAVNLFHAPESDVRTSPEIQIGRGEPIEAQASAWEITRRELWKWLLLVGLIVLLVEWYVYNRRVYL